jgi:hypothetical protein
LRGAAQTGASTRTSPKVTAPTLTERRDPMPEEQNKAVVRRFYEEVFNSGRLEVMDELVSPELVAHDALPSGVPERGPEP